jgi:hypothetical protein
LYFTDPTSRDFGVRVGMFSASPHTHRKNMVCVKNVPLAGVWFRTKWFSDEMCEYFDIFRLFKAISNVSMKHLRDMDDIQCTYLIPINTATGDRIFLD